MSSGGKGGKQSTVQEIPEWIKQPNIRNIARAEDVQDIGYMPYYGPDIAGFTQPQQQSMQANLDAGAAFGLIDPGMNAMDGMPQAQDFGGMSGYSSAPLFEMAVSEMQRKAPGYADEYDKLFRSNTGPDLTDDTFMPFSYNGYGGGIQMPNYNESNASPVGLGPNPTYIDQAMTPDTAEFYENQQAAAEAAAVVAQQQAAAQAEKDALIKQQQMDEIKRSYSNGFNFRGIL